MGCGSSKKEGQKNSQGSTGVTYAVLAEQNSVTSSAVIGAYSSNADFDKVAKKQTADILKRDKEDGEKLQKGIDLAIGKKVIPKDVEVEPTTKVDVLGKSADEVSDEITKALGEAATKGCVLVLQGLSGTGKGTTVAKLKAKLPKAITWSNGNIFRSLTLLAVTYKEDKKCSLEDAITPENLDSFVKMLSFAKHNGKDFDVKIDGLGVSALVSEIQNTELKKPAVASNIPTVAGVTQGEVINFVKDALKQMADDGASVLVEGREQTLNYIRTPYRFELVLSAEKVIGQRRAAQRMGATAFEALSGEGSKKEQSTKEDVKVALDAALAGMVKECD